MSTKKSSSQIKVCVILDAVIAYNGPSTQAITLASRLGKKGIVSFFVAFYRVDSSLTLPCVAASSAENEAREELVAGSRLYKPPKNIKIIWWLYYLILFWRLRRDYQLVHIYGIPQYSYFFFPLFKLLGKKIVLKMTGPKCSNPLSIQQERFGWLKLKLLLLIDRFIAPSSSLADSFAASRLPRQKLVIIPNGVDTGRFQPLKNGGEKQALRQQLELPQAKKIVLYVGALKPTKGLELLLDSWELIRKQYPRSVLVIIGPICLTCPWLRRREPRFIEAMRERVGLYQLGRYRLTGGKIKKNIHLLGPRDNIHRYFQAADIFAFPSRSEGLPNVILEAMASGLPCVTLAIPEISHDLITNAGEGITVATADSSVFAEAVLELLRDEARCQRLGQVGRQKMQQQFTLTWVTNQYIQLYQELLASTAN